MKKKKKVDITTILLVLVLIAGLSLLLYPSVANWWNERHQSKVISSYVQQLSTMTDEENDRIIRNAREYNKTIINRKNLYHLTEEEQGLYDGNLNIGGTGLMGYIDIPKIRVSLAIYHGTTDGILQVAVGHLDWTSLPVGGEGTHCVISAHRGLPSAKLFSDLDQMKEGDTFTLHILNETLTYKVFRILIVEPDDLDALRIAEGEDLCTLETCTPYGINTHRLLVTGRRVANEEAAQIIDVTSDALKINPLTVAIIIAVPLIGMVLFLYMKKPKERKRVTLEDLKNGGLDSEKKN